MDLSWDPPLPDKKEQVQDLSRKTDPDGTDEYRILWDDDDRGDEK